MKTPLILLSIAVLTLSGCGISADLGNQIGDPEASFVAGARRGIGVEVKGRGHAVGAIVFARKLNETLEVDVEK
tara:strand:+ start:216 stop:437 length:222 start_codon:yes stop_codon:yes gene_type:complete